MRDSRGDLVSVEVEAMGSSTNGCKFQTSIIEETGHNLPGFDKSTVTLELDGSDVAEFASGPCALSLETRLASYASSAWITTSSILYVGYISSRYVAIMPDWSCNYKQRQIVESCGASEPTDLGSNVAEIDMNRPHLPPCSLLLPALKQNSPIRRLLPICACLTRDVSLDDQHIQQAHATCSPRQTNDNIPRLLRRSSDELFDWSLAVGWDCRGGNDGRFGV